MDTNFTTRLLKQIKQLISFIWFVIAERKSLLNIQFQQ